MGIVSLILILLAFIVMFVVSLVVYCCLVVGSRADDWTEKYNKQEFLNENEVKL